MKEKRERAGKLAEIKENPSALSTLPDEYRYNLRFLKDAVKMNFNAIDYFPVAIREDKSSMNVILRNYHFDETVRAIRDAVGISLILAPSFFLLLPFEPLLILSLVAASAFSISLFTVPMWEDASILSVPSFDNLEQKRNNRFFSDQINPMGEEEKLFSPKV